MENRYLINNNNAQVVGFLLDFHEHVFHEERMFSKERIKNHNNVLKKKRERELPL